MERENYIMDVNFHIVYDDLSEQSGTITLEEVAELLAYLIAKHLSQILARDHERPPLKTITDNPPN